MNPVFELSIALGMRDIVLIILLAFLIIMVVLVFINIRNYKKSNGMIQLGASFIDIFIMLVWINPNLDPTVDGQLIWLLEIILMVGATFFILGLISYFIKMKKEEKEEDEANAKEVQEAEKAQKEATALLNQANKNTRVIK